MVQLARDLREELLRNNIDAMGEILRRNWELKRELASGISNDFIDRSYELAVKAGAEGGKLLGRRRRGLYAVLRQGTKPPARTQRSLGFERNAVQVRQQRHHAHSL